jgi:hypothetical protein
MLLKLRFRVNSNPTLSAMLFKMNELPRLPNPLFSACFVFRMNDMQFCKAQVRAVKSGYAGIVADLVKTKMRIARHAVLRPRTTQRSVFGFAGSKLSVLLVSRFLPASKVCLWCGSQHRPKHFNEGTYTVVTDCNSGLRDRFPLCQHLKGSKQPRLLSPTAK